MNVYGTLNDICLTGLSHLGRTSLYPNGITSNENNKEGGKSNKYFHTPEKHTHGIKCLTEISHLRHTRLGF